MRKIIGGAASPVAITGADDLLLAARPNGESAIRVSIGPSDPFESIPVVMDSAHHHLHEGEAFVASHLIDSLASGVSFDFRIYWGTLAGVGAPHLDVEVISTGEAESYFYEGTTFSANGALLVPANRNRFASNLPILTVASAPTVTAVGTLLWIGLTGSGKSAGSGDRAISEWILKGSTEYLFRVTSRVATNKILLRFNWYRT